MKGGRGTLKALCSHGLQHVPLNGNLCSSIKDSMNLFENNHALAWDDNSSNVRNARFEVRGDAGGEEVSPVLCLAEVLIRIRQCNNKHASNRV